MTLKIILQNELKSLMKKGDDFTIIDIREKYEVQNEGKLDFSLNIPMGELIDRLNEIPNTKKVIFHCSSGNRSQNFLNFLIMNDLYKENYFHLEGGFKAIDEK